MADVTFAHVPRPVWRNQMVIAPDAGNSVRRITIGRDARHDTLTGLCNGDARQCPQVSGQGNQSSSWGMTIELRAKLSAASSAATVAVSA